MPIADIAPMLQEAADTIDAAHTKQCDGCGKTGADGWALYCVRCAEAVKVDMEPVAQVLRHEATVKLDWISVNEAHNAKPGLLYTADQLAAAVAQAVTERDAVYEKQWADTHAAVAAERERAASLVESFCAEVLSKQSTESGSFNDSVNINIRLVAVMLPEIAAAIRREK
jgi:hypothetical protein